MATTIWLTYLLLNFTLIPLLFRLRYGKSPFVVSLLPRNRYDIIEHGYGWLIAWFTISLFCEPSPTANVLLSVCLVIVGCAIIAAAVYTLGPHWRIGQDATDASCVRVTSGMYRFVSHPIYQGMMLVSIGQTTLMSGDWRAIILLSATALYVVIQGRAELRRWRAFQRSAQMCRTTGRCVRLCGQHRDDHQRPVDIGDAINTPPHYQPHCK